MALLIFACKQAETKQNEYNSYLVSYKIGDYYFVKNTYSESSIVRITSKNQFHKIFGAALAMRENRKATEIDFSKDFVIGIILPESDRNTEILMDKLLLDDDQLVIDYSEISGDKVSYTIRPCLLLVLDKKYVDKGITSTK